MGGAGERVMVNATERDDGINLPHFAMGRLGFEEMRDNVLYQPKPRNSPRNEYWGRATYHQRHSGWKRRPMTW